MSNLTVAAPAKLAGAVRLLYVLAMHVVGASVGNPAGQYEYGPFGEAPTWTTAVVE